MVFLPYGSMYAVLDCYLKIILAKSVMVFETAVNYSHNHDMNLLNSKILRYLPGTSRDTSESDA